MQTDASEYRVGVALIQNGSPIAFASKTDVETHYANISNCLSVCFGLEKFHTYIYGRHVMVQNDHKLLEISSKTPSMWHAWTPVHASPYVEV